MIMGPFSSEGTTDNPNNHDNGKNMVRQLRHQRTAHVRDETVNRTLGKGRPGIVYIAMKD